MTQATAPALPWQTPLLPAPGTDGDPHTLAPEATADETPESAPLSGRWRLRPGRIIGGLFLLAALLPAALWLQHQSTHIVSRNAMVRAHLSELGSRVDGVVDAVLVEAGERVQRGQILVRLEDRHFRAELARAEAEYAALSARLETERAELVLAGRRVSNRIAQAEAEVRRSTAALAAAQSRSSDARDFHAARDALLAERAISGEVVRDAAAKARTAAALEDAARAEQEAATTALAAAYLDHEALSVREQQLRIVAAELEQAAARVERARADLDSTLIRAPADGAVIHRLAQAGMAVTAGMPTLSMWFSEDSWIEAWVDEADLGEFAEGNAVQVTAAALPGQTLQGRVERIGLATDYEMPSEHLPQPRAERMRHTPMVGVAIRIEDMPALLRPGISAVVNIRRGGGEA
jgi:membrane fusion protein (multidrug efflux system)